jgi:hypothetical protein
MRRVDAHATLAIAITNLHLNPTDQDASVAHGGHLLADCRWSDRATQSPRRSGA